MTLVHVLEGDYIDPDWGNAAVDDVNSLLARTTALETRQGMIAERVSTTFNATTTPAFLTFDATRLVSPGWSLGGGAGGWYVQTPSAGTFGITAEVFTADGVPTLDVFLRYTTNDGGTGHETFAPSGGPSSSLGQRWYSASAFVYSDAGLIVQVQVKAFSGTVATKGRLSVWRAR